MRQWQADACKLQGGLHSADDDNDHPMRRGAPDTGKSASRKPPQLATTADGAAAKVAAIEELSSLADVLELEEQRRRPGARVEASSSQKGARPRARVEARGRAAMWSQRRRWSTRGEEERDQIGCVAYHVADDVHHPHRSRSFSSDRSDSGRHVLEIRNGADRSKRRFTHRLYQLFIDVSKKMCG